MPNEWLRISVFGFRILPSSALTRDSLDDAGCGGEAECARHEAGGAKAGVAVNPQILLLTRRSADLTITRRINGRFPREHTLNAKRFLAAREAVAGAQQLPNVL